LDKTLPKPSRLVPVLLLALGLSLVAASITFLLRNSPLQTEPLAVPVVVNYSAPPLDLMDTAGNPASLAEYQGQVVLVNLWATWCPPCKKEMPALETFYREHKDDGFVIVAINDGDPTADVIQFVEEYELTFPVWLDPEYIATEQAFKTLNLPSSFIIDRSGRIVLRWVGGVDRKTLEQYVTPIIED
jgi:peroxiredoxin